MILDLDRVEERTENERNQRKRIDRLETIESRVQENLRTLLVCRSAITKYPNLRTNNFNNQIEKHRGGRLG